MLHRYYFAYARSSYRTVLGNDQSAHAVTRAAKGALSRLSLLFIAGLYLGSVLSVHAEETQPALTYAKDIKPWLVDNCYDCHGDGSDKGNVILDKHASEEALMKDKPFWHMVREAVITGVMPPTKRKKQPTQAEREMLANWIDKTIYHTDCNNPDPGRVTIRRLNRREYNFSIQDIFSVAFNPAEDFPPDDTGYGFDRIGDVLSLSPVLMDKYFIAAESIVKQAIHLGPPPAAEIALTSADFTLPNGDPDKIDAPFPRNAPAKDKIKEFSHPLTIKTDGEYEISVKFEVKSAYAYNGPLRYSVNLADIHKSENQFVKKQDVEDTITLKMKLTAGTYPLKITLDERDVNLDERYDYFAFKMVGASVRGPLHLGVYPKTHQLIFHKGPAPIDLAERTAYARDIISRYSELAFRRPADSAWVDAVTALAIDQAHKNNGNFEYGIGMALQTILVSPRFLFRIETQPRPNDPQETHLLDEFSLASRLSYFLWNSVPDEQLMTLAKTNALRKNWVATVKRMLADKKSERFSKDFLAQWLQIGDVETIPSGDKQFAHATSIRLAMRQETELLFNHIVNNNRDVIELLTAHYTFLNQELAKWYQIDGVIGKKMRYVELPKDHVRGGILTHGSYLAVTSNPTRTSPVKRGIYVLENILDTPPPPAPPDVPELEEAKKHAEEGVSLRKLLEIHRDNPNCSGCHARMDPIGLGLEQFDLAGRFRTTEQDKPIETQGELISGEKFNSVQELRAILGTKKREFYRCVTQKLMTYALGRGLEHADSCTVKDLTQRMVMHGGTFSELLLGILDSDQFQKRRGDGERH
jgi:Protein of unknown function (DUF1592)/Protein of unknown function (DUF1588)/Protein of unknown function (DUF1585)/Protein of unknown function (DUF1587)/Protein of unknown function (DUF1595)/Planctomycete cytochrome C